MFQTQYRHRSGSQERIYKEHKSISVLVSVQSGEDIARLKEIACEEADSIFKKKGVERG